MRHYLKLAILFFGALAFFPALVGLIGAFDHWAGIALALFGVPTVLVALLIGAVVFFIHGIRCAKEISSPLHKGVVVLASPVLAFSAVLLMPASLGLGAHFRDLAFLGRNWSSFEEIVARVQVVPGPGPDAEHRGMIYLTDPGPPVRVAFEPVGIGDNWSGVVFDPTGDVMLAEGFDDVTGQLRGPQRIVELFGGDLIGCRHLWDSYYKCSFT